MKAFFVHSRWPWSTFQCQMRWKTTAVSPCEIYVCGSDCQQRCPVCFPLMKNYPRPHEILLSCEFSLVWWFDCYKHLAWWLQVRMAALGVMNALFDGMKQFLMVAEDRFLIIWLIPLCSILFITVLLVIVRTIITMSVFMVLLSWQSHCESSPGSFDACRTAPSGRRPKTKPDDLGCESSSSLQAARVYTHHCHLLLLLSPEADSFYRPTESRRLSRPGWLVAWFTCL